MSEFTKGEWEVIDATLQREQSLFVHVEGVGIVCRLTKVIDTHIPLSKQDIANAHLIAAAPSMYAALEALSKGEGLQPGTTIESILLKARGEQL